MKDVAKHPCFNIEAKGTYGRVHLPIAPKCNIQCNYCNRKYDCVNESRPGVTSAVLSPEQAVHYVGILRKKMPNLSVIGIAGPGDPFANANETLETLRLIKEKMPDMLFCLSTNGLELEPYIDEIANLGVTHVTITMNGLDPEALGKIYSWVRLGKKVYRGSEAGRVLLEQQLKCIPLLKAKGIIVKINTIVLPGYNDLMIKPLAEKVSHLGADLMNCIPVHPNAETVFENIEEPDKKLMARHKIQISEFIKPMTHCARCRADAAGLLGQDDPETACLIKECSTMVVTDEKLRNKVAVATYEGLLVNQHLGEARNLYIFEQTKNGYKFVEQRKTPDAGIGEARWKLLSETLSDCRALLVGSAGEKPLKVLQASGIKVIQMTGLIDLGLDAVYSCNTIRALPKTDASKSGKECGGNMRGCA